MSGSRRAPLIYSMLMLVCVGCATVFAQATGRLTGTVIDPAGASIPKAVVSLYLAGGHTAVLSTSTSADGVFDFIAVRPDVYTIVVESPGFAKHTVGEVKVDPARQMALPPIQLQLSTSSQTVEVAASAQGLDTASAEVATTVSQSQITNLPVVGRQVANLFVTQAGVSQNNRTATVINGMRPSFSNMMLDGILLQDSVRLNTLDLIPNRLVIAQVAEFTVSTSNSSPTIGGAASTVTMITPSGTNQMHGAGYWFNRNRYFSANDWFNNKDGLDRPNLNLNQIGGTLGGAVIKDRLFFFSNYEAYRLRRQTVVSNTILTPTARQGIMQYRSGSSIQQFNVLTAAGLQASPFIKKLLAMIPENGNSSSRGDGLNTTGYSLNARYNTTRDNITGKVDFNLSTKHVFSGTYLWNRDIQDRTTSNTQYSVTPPFYNDGRGNLVSASWRWTPTPALTNELRGGFNYMCTPFKLTQPNQPYYLNGLVFGSPYQTTERGEGRTVHQYNIQDNANWVRGRHALSFGAQFSLLRASSYDYNGTAVTNGVSPVYTIGISQASPYGFNAGSIPGASSSYVTMANNLLASLAGLVSGSGQYFNVTSRKSGFVPGAPSTISQKFDQYALYVLDNFKLTRRVTVTLGLRWDYFQPVDETNGLSVTPRLIDNNPVKTLLGNASLDFAGTTAGYPYYKKDWNNLAPNVALAWNLRENGATVFRTGFNIAYLNDNAMNSVWNTINANNGLHSSIEATNLVATADAPPSIATPAFQLPTTTREQFLLQPSSPPVEAIMDPNLATPYVQQWTASLQHRLKGDLVVEARYIGNHAVKMWRQIDYNQINVKQAGYLEDFVRARNNGFLAQQAGKGFVAAYNPSIPGSQPLTFFPLLPYGGSLGASLVASYLRTGEVGSLAQIYQQNGYFPSSIPGFSYFPNPYLLYSSLTTNQSNASYNALQVEVRKRTRSGIQFQANYTFGKALTDSNALRGIDAQLDNGSYRIEKARADYDQNHAFKLNHYIPLPLGKGHRIAPQNRILDRIVSDWALSGFLVIYSGSPVSILSSRGTLNRAARSGWNTVDTTLTHDQLKAVTGVFMTGDGPYWLDPKHINSDTTGVAADGSAPFDGQIFFNPQPGKLGTLQRRSLDCPGFWNYNFAAVKSVRIRERHSMELHADFFNVLNHANFYVFDQKVNGASFGKIDSQNYSNDGVGPRVMQFGLYYKF